MQFIEDLHNKGISWGVVITGLILWNKIMKRKRLDQRDKRMESKIDLSDMKIDAIMKAVGVEWTAPISDPSKKSLISVSAIGSMRSWAVLFLARIVKRFTNSNIGRKQRMNMGSLNKTILIPLLSFIVLIVKQATGYEIPSQVVDVGADAILSIVTIIGIFIHPTSATTTPTLPPVDNSGADKSH